MDTLSQTRSPSIDDDDDAAEAADRYVFRVSGVVWQIVGELRAQLLASGAWQQATRDDQPVHLLLADRGRVNFAREMIGRRAPERPRRFAHLASTAGELQSPLCMVNVYRGCNEITNKSALVKTMRRYAREHALTPLQMEYMPPSFVIRPGDKSDERALFRAEFEREQLQEAATAAAAASSSTGAVAAAPSKNVWIAKANRGAKGERPLHRCTRSVG